MSRRGPHDVVVVGGGVVGAACALALAQAGLDACLVEARRPPAWSRHTPVLRVYPLAPDNLALLDA
ncbi:FAD-dependent oxidoreductase, partial [Luteimonas sp. SDU101]|uniref:FAD-dependent oxidoreductase n=1 Tax=Luteimonas sp. SDU101 TaxID=3422593 RepID=UPI003EB9732D